MLDKPRLFLLKPNFVDTKIDHNGFAYYCPDCAMIEGVLAYYPQLKNDIEIIYVNFERPRQLIIDIIGEENQGCPLLIISDKSENNHFDTSYFKSSGRFKFVSSVNFIAKYLSDKFGIGQLHP